MAVRKMPGFTRAFFTRSDEIIRQIRISFEEITN